MNNEFNNQQKEVLQLLKLMDENNILSHVILTGSWAEYVYAQAGVLPGFELTLRTIDIDFLIKNLRRPAEPISIPQIAKNKGYSISRDVMMGTTKLFSPGGLEIEFLIPQMGSGVNPVLKTNLGVNAQALRHMEGLVKHSITADLLGMNVQVPCPEIYVLHKMIINNARSAAKQPKDRISIVRLLPYISLEKTKTLFDTLTKKEKARIRSFVEEHGEELGAALQLDGKIKLTKFVSLAFPNDTFKVQKTSLDAPTDPDDR